MTKKKTAVRKGSSPRFARKARPIARKQPSANTTARLTALENDVDQLIQTLEGRFRKHAARLDALEGRPPAVAAGEGE